MSMTTTQSARLADVRRRINGLRDERAAARADRDRAREAFSAPGASVNGPEHGRAQRAVEALAAAEDRLAAAMEEERFLLGRVAGSHADLYGESFLRNPEQLRSLAQVAESSAPLGRVSLGVGVAREDIVSQLGMYAAAGTVGNVARGATYVGVAEAPRRPLRLLDLIPTLPMDGRSIEYSREIGSLDTAAETAEGAIKPAHAVDYEDAEAVARTVAHFTKLRKQQLADTPALEGAIRNRLAYGVLRRLESQILAGDGTGENLRGILSTTGIASVPFSASELAADQTLEGLVAVLLSEATPNFIALNPRDWANMLKAKATGDGQYFSGGPFVATAERLWGTVAVPATGIPAGRARRRRDRGLHALRPRGPQNAPTRPAPSADGPRTPPGRLARGKHRSGSPSGLASAALKAAHRGVSFRPAPGVRFQPALTPRPGRVRA